MKKILLGLMLSGFLFGCAKDSILTEIQVKEQLVKSIPGLPKDAQVLKSSTKGLYEVVIGRKIFYVSSDGKYLIFGNMIDVATKTNLTEKRTQELSKIDWNKLPLDLAIKVVNGNGERQIAIFSDPDCPYCKLFEQQTVANLKNTTVYTFLFPLPMHPNAKDDAKKIWCSQNKAATWISWMRSQVALPTVTNCDTAGLDKIYEIGTKDVQVDGTPTLILSNGQILSGAMPADQLLSMIDAASGKVIASEPVKANITTEPKNASQVK